MMNSPKISIVVPIYKVEKYLNKCIDSILSQTFSDFELILVDDGSPDNCPEICDEYAKKDERIKVIHKENGGLSDARNAGIKAASGEYIGLIDSDDYIASDMYEDLYRNACENDADISVCGAVVVAENQEAEFLKETKTVVMSNKEALEQMIYNHLFEVNAWNKLYKKDLFSDICYPVGMLYEDLATTYKLIDKSKTVVHSDGKKYAYVQRGGSIMNTTGYSVKIDKIDIVEEMADFFLKKEHNDKILSGVFRYLLNDIYKMSSTKKLTDNTDYLSGYKKIYEKYGKQIKTNKFLSCKEKTVLGLTCYAPRLLQFVYSIGR